MYRLATGSVDKTVRVWNVQTGECTSTLHGHTEEVTCVAFDGNTIVSGSDDGTVRVWRAPFTEGAECARVLKGHTSWMFLVWLCAPPNEHIVVSVDYDNAVYVHDIRTDELVCEPFKCRFCKSS